MAFIEEIAAYVQKYAPQFGIKVCSPIIAQAILESASGTSNKVKNPQTGEMYHNYFGLKYTVNRCPSGCGFFYEVGSEQNPDGSYRVGTMKWQKAASMEMGVKCYFEFLMNGYRYDNLKGITDPKTYLETIKSDGYATSLKYVDNVFAVIEKYDLTKYDSQNVEEGNKMIINVHAGHNPDGKTACGAVGLIKESTEARKVKDLVITMLRTLGHTVNDCTVDDGTNQSSVLQKIVKKCNAHNADLDVSIHFNSGASDKSGNGKTTGTEVLIYSTGSKSNTCAYNTVSAISKLGFTNRGVKIRSDLYVLKNTNAPAMLIECCFVDDADDVKLYNAELMANAIVKGITGKTVDVTPTIEQPTTSEFKVKILIDELNYRSGPGTSYPVKGVVKKNQIYTIVETSGNWGKLKSGAGWISVNSKYVKRV